MESPGGNADAPDADAGVGSDDFYRELVANASEAMLTVTTDSEVVFANGAVQDIFGYDPEELVGESLQTLVPERLRNHHLEGLETYIETGERSIDWSGVELPALHADGHEVPVLISFQEHEYDGERLFSGIVRDIRKRKTREQQLEESNSRLETLLENSPDMITVHDDEGTLLRVNRAFREELGYDEGELLGEKVWDIDVTVDPDEAREYWQELEYEDPRRFEGEFQQRDGSTFPVEIHLVCFEVSGQDHFLVFGRDVTEQKSYQRRLERQNERLDRFASIVSHDLRNPLTVAKGNLELARETDEDEYFEAAAAAHERMQGLIEDLLALAQSGDEELDLESVSLQNVVESCWSTVDTADATLEFEGDGTETCRADVGLLRQLLENFFRNAVEHAGDDVTVTVTATGDGFLVGDDGVGIPAEERADVLEPGYSSDDSGSGLGLGIADRVAAIHGWDLTVGESESGGARFEITGVETR